MKTKMGSCMRVPLAMLVLAVTVLAMLVALPAMGEERHNPVSGIDFVWVVDSIVLRVFP
jgi:hypothetical protein